MYNCVPYNKQYNNLVFISVIIALHFEDTLQFGCGPTGWDVSINVTMLRHLYPDTSVSQIKLNEPRCIGRVMGDTVVFHQHYTECSSVSLV